MTKTDPHDDPSAGPPPLDAPYKAVTYASYLRVDELLSLQTPLSEPEEHDETLFIVVHQVYELWFKQLLHEVAHLVKALGRDDTPTVFGTFKRVLSIFKTIVGQIDVIETMTPVQFLSFRARLESASGFQSRQFRCLEAALGKRPVRLGAPFTDDPSFMKVLGAPTLHDAFVGHLARMGVAVPADVLARQGEEPIVESAALRSALVDVYRNRHELSSLCELMVDLDEGVQEWRYRHVKMVERTIGFKRGTGGSSGAEYLRSTLFQPLFADLWALRAEL